MHIRLFPFHEVLGREAKRRRYESDDDQEDVVDGLRFGHRHLVGNNNNTLGGPVALQPTFSFTRTPGSSDCLGVDVFDEDEREHNLAYDKEEEEEYRTFVEFSRFDHNIAQKVWDADRQPRVFRPYVFNPDVLNSGESEEETPPVVDFTAKPVITKKKISPLSNTPTNKTTTPKKGPNTRFAGTKRVATGVTPKSVKKTPAAVSLTTSPQPKPVENPTVKPNTSVTPLQQDMQQQQQQQQNDPNTQQQHQQAEIKPPQYNFQQQQYQGASYQTSSAQMQRVSVMQNQGQQVMPIPPRQMQPIQTPPQHILFQHQWQVHQQEQERARNIEAAKWLAEERARRHLEEEQRNLERRRQHEELKLQQQQLLMSTNPASVQEQKLKMLDRVRRSKWRMERKKMNKLKKSDMDNRIADPEKLSELEKKLEEEMITAASQEEISGGNVASNVDSPGSTKVGAIKNESTFMQYVYQLQQFKLVHGHCNVQYNDRKYGGLGRWIKRQRYLYKLYVEGNPRSSMTAERIQILDQLGMIWDSQQAVWNERYEQLLEFKRIHGHVRVPKEYGHGFGRWVGGQKSAYKRWKRGEVTHAQPDRMAMLEAAGFGQLYPDLQGKNNAHSEDNDHEKHPESDEHD